jgi:hypothetical protein
VREALENKRLDRIAEVVKELNTISADAHERLLKLIGEIAVDEAELTSCTILLQNPDKLRDNVTEWLRGNSDVPIAPSAEYAAAARRVMAELRPGYFRNAGRVDAELKRFLEKIEIACATGLSARN